MSARNILYAVVATLAVAGVAAVSIGLYRGGSLAVSGWTEIVAPGRLSERHAFLSDRCESCHTPTKGVEATACITCHTTAAKELGRQSTAFHATSRECRGCHLEHRGGVRPTAMDHTSLLRTGAFWQGSDTSTQAIAHQMADDLRRFLSLPKPDERERAALDCANCHSNREPHRGLFGRECAGCHGLESWQIAGFLHPSPTSKECAQCHQAPPSHYMGHFIMMDRMITGQEHATVTQCFLCHRTDSFNDIKDVGWFKHH
ncbi:class III cytochrome C family protein [Bradyrhizobium sp. CSA207]|uniref:cytochrome c3 family protein n=1 Tax=Bradyrhizobium sp. CSA207 TaxID=2698826 RepID=UPI0023AF04D2|nr:cytochrome c3 family protein [Bradyrhizobium sp. CSA207]MDE5445075.1 class III cytochrome C family protein [Bradyrhizobium sp. CSA207]